MVAELGDVFLANDLEVAPLLRALFMRPEFYAADGDAGPRPHAHRLRGRGHAPRRADGQVARSAWAETMGQILLNPPNVAGWKANGYWLNTSALSRPRRLRQERRDTLRDDGGFDYLFAMAADAAVDHVANFFGITSMSPSPATRCRRTPGRAEHHQGNDGGRRRTC